MKKGLSNRMSWRCVFEFFFASFANIFANLAVKSFYPQRAQRIPFTKACCQAANGFAPGLLPRINTQPTGSFPARWHVCNAGRGSPGSRAEGISAESRPAETLSLIHISEPTR